jgi:hypothetical protein
MSFCWFNGVTDKPWVGQHEYEVENYICSSAVAGPTNTVICCVVGGAFCVSAKNIRFYQVGVESRDAGCEKKPVVYCCFAESRCSHADQKQILWPKATSFGARFAQNDNGRVRERKPTTGVVKNHHHLPSFARSRSMRFAKKHRFSMVLGGNPCASHKSTPCRPATLQIHDAARNLLTSLGVRRHGVPFGEKNPWNLMRIMPPQGSVEVSHRSCHGSRFFPPFLRSLFTERT